MHGHIQRAQLYHTLFSWVLNTPNISPNVNLSERSVCQDLLINSRIHGSICLSNSGLSPRRTAASYSVGRPKLFKRNPTSWNLITSHRITIYIRLFGEQIWLNVSILDTKQDLRCSPKPSPNDPMPTEHSKSATRTQRLSFFLPHFRSIERTSSKTIVNQDIRSLKVSVTNVVSVQGSHDLCNVCPACGTQPRCLWRAANLMLWLRWTCIRMSWN